jgi:osmoprotectant transport system substrate-binding protein
VITRRRALGLAAGALLLPSCSARSGRAVVVGSKNFTESFVIADIYARALEAHGIPVRRRLDLGSTQIALAALQHGDIDLYPEYTGTALVDVLHHAPIRDPNEVLRIVARSFARRFDAIWLQPSPMNDSQALATTHAVAARYDLSTLSQLAVLAPSLRLATIPEFLGRPDGLPGLQRFYGGFHFAHIETYDIGLKYEALLRGEADVATAFTTDAQIVLDRLVVLRDDRHFWPPYHVAPVVRARTLAERPAIRTILNALAPAITTARMQRMNAAVEGEHLDPDSVARQFLRMHPV